MKYTYRTCCHPVLGRIRTICDGKMGGFLPDGCEW